MLAQRLLDQHRRDVLAAAPDHVALAIDEVEPSVLVQVAEVARQEPAVAQRAGGGLGILEVRRHARGRVDGDLADRAGRERGAGVVQHLHPDAGHRRSARAGARRDTDRLDRHHPGVGGSEALEHVVHPEALAHPRSDRRAPQPEDHAQPMRALERRRLPREEHREDRSQGVDHGRTRLVHQRPELGRMERLRERDGRTGMQRRDHGAPRVAVEERGHREDDVVGHQPERRDEVRAARTRAPVGEDHALRAARRARRVEERGDVGRADARVRHRLGTARYEALGSHRAHAELAQVRVAGRVGHDDPGFGMTEDVAQLVAPEPGVHRIQDRRPPSARRRRRRRTPASCRAPG